jgi:ribosome recycling factor
MTNFDDIKKRMEGGIKTFANELSGLRTGRASGALLDGVMVEAYGGRTPLNQVGAVSAPEARLLTVQVWDATLTKAVEKAISNAGLGLNPMAEGSLIRVPLPDLSEDRRKELVKVAGKYAESARIAIRNVRRDGMDDLKKLEKDGKISKDDHHRQSEELQKLTDQYIKKIDEAASAKEKEIMQV